MFFRALVITASNLTITACATTPAQSGDKTTNIKNAKINNSRLAEARNDPVVCEKKKITKELIPPKYTHRNLFGIRANKMPKYVR